MRKYRLQFFLAAAMPVMLRLLQNSVIHLDVKFMVGIHPRKDFRIRFYDYKRFSVESTVTAQ